VANSHFCCKHGRTDSRFVRFHPVRAPIEAPMRAVAVKSPAVWVSISTPPSTSPKRAPAKSRAPYAAAATFQADNARARSIASTRLNTVSAGGCWSRVAELSLRPTPIRASRARLVTTSCMRSVAPSSLTRTNPIFTTVLFAVVRDPPELPGRSHQPPVARPANRPDENGSNHWNHRSLRCRSLPSSQPRHL